MSKVTLIHRPTRRAWAPGYEAGDEVKVDAAAAAALEATGAWIRKGASAETAPAEKRTPARKPAKGKPAPTEPHAAQAAAEATTQPVGQEQGS